MAQSQKVIGGIFRINFSCIPLFPGGLIFDVGKKLFLVKRMELFHSHITQKPFLKCCCLN